MASKEDAPPLEPLEVALLDGLPSELCIARDVGADVEAVLLGLDLLDLVHQALLECPKQKRAPPSTPGEAPSPRRSPSLSARLAPMHSEGRARGVNRARARKMCKFRESDVLRRRIS